MVRGTYLGVGATELNPILSHQLRLPLGFGLAVTRVEPGSPADGALAQHDISTQRRLCTERERVEVICDTPESSPDAPGDDAPPQMDGAGSDAQRCLQIGELADHGQTTTNGDLGGEAMRDPRMHPRWRRPAVNRGQSQYIIPLQHLHQRERSTSCIDCEDSAWKAWWPIHCQHSA